MAFYTVSVREICEDFSGIHGGYANVNYIIQNAAPRIFDFNFPFYDEKERLNFEIKILRHFYMREIGLETIGLWKLKLEDKLNLIMPFYNKLYSSALLVFDPFINTDLTLNSNRDKKENGNSTQNTKSVSNAVTKNTGKNMDFLSSNTRFHDQTGTGVDEHSSSENESKHVTEKLDWTLENDTPQGQLNDIKEFKYLSAATHIQNNDNASENGTSSTKHYSETATTKDNESLTLDSNTYNINTTSAADNTADTASSGKVNNQISDAYIESIKGKRGTDSYSKMLEDYRNTFINIDKMIFEELEDLFILLWE